MASARFAANGVYGETVSIEVPAHGSHIPQLATYTELALSPDGTKIAFTASDVQSAIWVRSLDSLEARKIDGTAGGRAPFWSPDGKNIGFFAGGELRRISIDGGSELTLCKTNGGSGDWGPDDQIVFCVWGSDVPPNISTPEQRRAFMLSTNAIQIVPAKGGTPRAITNGETWDMWPQFFSGGKDVLFFRNYGPLDQRTGLYAQSLNGGPARFVARSVSKGLVSSGDRLFYVQDSILVSQKFDIGAMKPTGEPLPIATPVFFFGPTGAADFAISKDHSVIAYLRSQLPTELKWMDRNGREIGALGPAAVSSNFRLSPDETRVVEEITDARRSVPDLWLMDVRRTAISRVTDEAPGAFSGIWDRSGNTLIASVADASAPTSAPQVTIIPLDGRPRLALSRMDGPQSATSITPDGADIIYSVARGKDIDIERVPFGGGKTVPILNSHFNETQGVVSPDGQWIAYVSDESGRFEVYVQPLRTKGERVQVSSSGGSEPRWSRDGRELFFIDSLQTLNSVPVVFSPSFTPANPSRLFRVTSAGMMEFGEFGSVHYDVTSSPQRFLVRTLPGQADSPPIGVILNWNAAKHVDE